MNKVISLILMVTSLAFAGSGKTGAGKVDSLRINAVASSSKLSSATGVWWGSENAPVVVWFHGGMTSGNCEKGFVAGRDIHEMTGYTSVSVSACRNNHWLTQNAVEWVDAALDSVGRMRKSPVSEVFLVGISDGSLGVIGYSLYGRRLPRGRVLMSSYGAALGPADRLASQANLRRGRWRFIQGGSDRLYPAQETVPWMETFCRNVGVECDLKFDPAGEHDWSFWQNRHKEWILEIFSK